ncbi:MAG: hypothetical protein HUJ90_04450 [Bacteroidales bacterium]|nr:hypothetical protein [Bacteroidales bacterium]
MSIFKPHNFYIFLWVLYYLQGVLYPSGGIIGQSLLLLCIMFGFYHFYQLVIAHKSPQWLKGLNAMVLLFVVYGSIAIVKNPVVVGDGGAVLNNQTFLKNALMSFLAVYSCYYFISKGYWSEKRMRVYALVLLALNVVRYFMNKNVMMELLSREEVTNNMAYNFVDLLPCLFLFSKSRTMQMAWLAVLAYFILSGFKRGAILVGGLCICYFLMQAFKNSQTRRQKLMMALWIAGAVAAGIWFVGVTLSSSDYFQQRVNSTQEGNFSGRDILYGRLWQVYKWNFSPFEMIVGKGAHQTYGIAGNFAHQDWLELLIDCGLIGVLVYLFFYVNAFLCAVKSKKGEWRTMFLMSILIIFVTSFFSMGYESIGINMGIWMAWGAFMMGERDYC